ncbi:MAG: hypothetical protein ACRCVG_02700 [Methanobacteriaceae archaeon]
MIEDKIQVLRQAAKISTEQSSDKLWCVVAGNEELVNDIAYKAISSKDRVKILFRESSELKEALSVKKFDFILIYGDSSKIRDLSHICKEHGGAYIQIAPFYVRNEPNLLLLLAPEDSMKQFVGDVEKAGSKFKLLLEDETVGFIETDVKLSSLVPKMIKDVFGPLFNVTDLTLTTILISVDESNLGIVKGVANANKIFTIDFKDILEE